MVILRATNSNLFFYLHTLALLMAASRHSLSLHVFCIVTLHPATVVLALKSKYLPRLTTCGIGVSLMYTCRLSHSSNWVFSHLMWC